MRFLLLLVSMLVICSARYFQTSFKFSLFGRNKGWMYLDKMTFAPGSARVELETTTEGLPYGANSELFLQAVPEGKWEVESMERCNSTVRMPLAVHKISLDGQTTSSSFSFEVEDYETYYLVMKDCQSRFLSEYNNSNLQLKVQLHLLNNEREVGEEEDHWYVLPFIIIAGLVVVHFYMREFRLVGTTDPEWSKMLLFIGTVTQVSSLFWKAIGFVVYSSTGSDYFFFHLIYLLLHSTSEAAIVGLISLIGFGWTLTFNQGKHFEIFIPLVGCLAFVNIIITMITKMGHDHDRHHLFDNVGGGILIALRLLLSAIFLGGSIWTFRKVRVSLKQFVWKLMVLGLLYIGSMPLVVLVANAWVAARERHEFVFVCIEIIKFSTNMIIWYEMNVKHSEYNRVNYKNASFLPEDDRGFR